MNRNKKKRTPRWVETLNRQEWMIRLRQRLGLIGPEEMFARNRNRLTISYTSLMMLFLLAFIIIVYALLFSVISREQAADLQTLVSQELADYQQDQQSEQNGKPTKPPSDEGEVQKDRFFYYVIDTNGKLLQTDETYPNLRSEILRHLKHWSPGPSDVRYLLLEEHEHDILVMMAGRTIMDGDKVVGMLYTGKDITFYMHTFMRLLEIFVGLLVAFFVMAMLGGHLMARRAMVPIMNSFSRQREFVADASHELRTPLMILQSSVEVIELEDSENLSEFSRKVLDDMKDEVKRMSKLVSDLLTLARSDAGETRLKMEEFDLVAVAHQLLRSFQHLTATRQIELKLEASNTLAVTGDQERLKQLLYILMDNAIKYSNKPGDVVLTLKKERIEQQEQLCIQVRDEGIGIEPEQQERIFDRFYRSDRIRSREMGGTGLGLSIARFIVESHNGTISVTSKIGEGSTFTVWLPQK